MKSRSVRAGREGEISKDAESEEGVDEEGAKARESRREAVVALTSLSSCSYSASSWMSIRITGTSVVVNVIREAQDGPNLHTFTSCVAYDNAIFCSHCNVS